MSDTVKISIDKIENINQVKAVLHILVAAHVGFQKNGGKPTLQISKSFVDAIPDLAGLIDD